MPWRWPLEVLHSSPGDCADIACLRDCHRELGDPFCVASSIGIVRGAVGGSGRERGACGGMLLPL